MKTVYSNSDHPKFVKWSSSAALIIGIICLILFIVLKLKDGSSISTFTLYFCTFALIYAALLGGDYYLGKYTVDEDTDTITDSRHKKYPVRISKVKTITYKENKKGKFRSLILHDDGIGFMDVRTTKKNADLMTEQLLKANPSIEVKHVNYV